MIFGLVVAALGAFLLGLTLQGYGRFNAFINLDTRKWKFYTVMFSLMVAFGGLVVLI